MILYPELHILLSVFLPLKNPDIMSVKWVLKILLISPAWHTPPVMFCAAIPIDVIIRIRISSVLSTLSSGGREGDEK